MTEQFLTIDVEKLLPDPAQPRQTFLEEEIDRIATSIRARGILQPLRVRRDEARDCWILVAGECRLRGARRAGLRTVPCVVMEGEPSETDILADQISENVIRNSLRPSELAKALTKLKTARGCNSRTLAEELGLSGSAITRAEALLTLSSDILEMVDDGRLAESVAYEISRLDDPQAQRELAFAAAGGKLNREQVTEAVRGVVPKRNVTPKSSRVTARIDGLSFTVSGSDSLTWDGLLAGLDRLRREAKKLSEGGKEITELARVLRAS